MIIIHRNVISASAHPIACSLKKIKLQTPFKANCITNTNRAIFLCAVSGNFHTRQKEIPISIYNTVQTGANTQPGGIKNGFSRPVDQEPTALAVAKPAPKPTSNVNPSDRINFTKGLIAFVKDWFIINKFKA